MINPATRPSDELNDFTQTLLDTYRPTVRLRNGTLVQPEYKPAEDKYCTDAFYAEDYRYCWNLDGTSVTRSDYDMMEIVRDD